MKKKNRTATVTLSKCDGRCPFRVWKGDCNKDRIFLGAGWVYSYDRCIASWTSRGVLGRDIREKDARTAFPKWCPLPESEPAHKPVYKKE